MASVLWPSNWLINTDWNDATSIAAIESKTEVGPPIRRLRSHNVKHALTVSVDMDYTQIDTVLRAFVYDTNGGIEPFMFRSPVDSQLHTTYLDMGSGQPYTLKRKDKYTYTVSFKVYYYILGAF